MPMLPLWPPPEEPREAIELLMPIELAVGVDQRAAGVAGVDRGEVWIALVTTGVRRLLLLAEPAARSSRRCVTGRSRALTMPVVTVPARPSGLPMAMTGSPTLILSESPRAIGVRSLGGVVRA